MPYAARIKGKNAKLSLLQSSVHCMNSQHPFSTQPVLTEVRWIIATKDWNIQEKRNKDWICEYHVTYKSDWARQCSVSHLHLSSQYFSSCPSFSKNRLLHIGEVVFTRKQTKWESIQNILIELMPFLLYLTQKTFRLSMTQKAGPYSNSIHKLFLSQWRRKFLSIGENKAM